MTGISSTAIVMVLYGHLTHTKNALMYSIFMVAYLIKYKEKCAYMLCTDFEHAANNTMGIHV